MYFLSYYLLVYLFFFVILFYILNNKNNNEVLIFDTIFFLYNYKFIIFKLNIFFKNCLCYINKNLQLKKFNLIWYPLFKRYSYYGFFKTHQNKWVSILNEEQIVKKFKS